MEQPARAYLYPSLMQETRGLEDQLWPAVVVPLFQKHFRSELGGMVPINYENWLNDTEFINMFSFWKIPEGRIDKT
jgi:hypothetical protein